MINFFYGMSYALISSKITQWFVHLEPRFPWHFFPEIPTSLHNNASISTERSRLSFPVKSEPSTPSFHHLLRHPAATELLLEAISSAVTIRHFDKNSQKVLLSCVVHHRRTALPARACRDFCPSTSATQINTLAHTHTFLLSILVDGLPLGTKWEKFPPGKANFRIFCWKPRVR